MDYTPDPTSWSDMEERARRGNADPTEDHVLICGRSVTRRLSRFPTLQVPTMMHPTKAKPEQNVGVFSYSGNKVLARFS